MTKISLSKSWCDKATVYICRSILNANRFIRQWKLFFVQFGFIAIGIAMRFDKYSFLNRIQKIVLDRKHYWQGCLKELLTSLWNYYMHSPESSIWVTNSEPHINKSHEDLTSCAWKIDEFMYVGHITILFKNWSCLGTNLSFHQTKPILLW